MEKSGQLSASELNGKIWLFMVVIRDYDDNKELLIMIIGVLIS